MNVPPRTTLVRSDGSRVVHCSVIMAEQMHAALRAMAKEQDRAISSIVRAALRAYLPNLPPDHFADASKKVDGA